MLALDFDDIPRDKVEAIATKTRKVGYFVIVHSTRKHAPDKPRWRIIFVLNRTVTVDEYGALARKVAELIDIEACDPASFTANQLMFWPSHSADAEPIFWYEDLPLLDVDEVLSLYIDWHDVTEWPGPKKEQQAIRRAVQTKSKQRDPLEKEGLVGEFCRVYPIQRAIAEFLPEAYEPFKGKDDRYTFTGGSTTGGVVSPSGPGV